MHKYLRAIGFSKYNKKRDTVRPLLDLRDSVVYSLFPDYARGMRSMDTSEPGVSVIAFGLRLYGEYGEGQAFEPEYCFPYADSDVVSTTVAPCVVERQCR